jgi:hypothetical protein
LASLGVRIIYEEFYQGVKHVGSGRFKLCIALLIWIIRSTAEGIRELLETLLHVAGLCQRTSQGKRGKSCETHDKEAHIDRSRGVMYLVLIVREDELQGNLYTKK